MHHAVRMADQLGAFVAGDLAELVVDVGDHAMRIGHDHDGVLVDGELVAHEILKGAFGAVLGGD